MTVNFDPFRGKLALEEGRAAPISMMGKRRRSVASEVNESDEEDPTTHSGVSQHKRVCVDKWSFPDELKSAVGWAVFGVAVGLQTHPAGFMHGVILTFPSLVDPLMSEII